MIDTDTDTALLEAIEALKHAAEGLAEANKLFTMVLGKPSVVITGYELDAFVAIRRAEGAGQ